MSTDVNDFISSCDAGVLEQKISAALSEVAANVVTYSQKGKVVLTFDVSQLGTSSQVMCSHKIVHTLPTARGKISAEDASQTPFHVGRNGKLTLFPEDQSDMFDLDKKQIQRHSEKH
ncbi:hypothetical protein [Hahella ganghwensis]|uniref:hypothetical protein n=1 Tax=Hahella ganghwensis TaxID=286420 RepID=UPI0003651773|nr:hypothetical protein [Hahella ganghwensis]